MKKNIFNVVCIDNNRKYAVYWYKVNWIPENIINTNDIDGYIVQKVIFRNNTNINITKDNKKRVDYYEAWKVVNKNVIRDNIDDCDDMISCGSEYDIYDFLSESYGESGTIEYYAEVFWIGKSDPLFSKIDNWKKGTVSLANGLKSVLCSDCKELNNYQPIFIRAPFIHEVNFKDKRIIEDAILELYNKQINKKEFIDYFLSLDINDKIINIFKEMINNNFNI